MNDLGKCESPCVDWPDITKSLSEFSPPEMSCDIDGSITEELWVFRGLKSSLYQLEPAIEREAKSKTFGWATLELLVSSEFKARAHMHLSTALIPADQLTWLAQMQHYGVPTRLLDFTYSPYVALYFAIRNGYYGRKRTHVRLWAVNAGAVNKRFWQVARNASEKEDRRNGTWQPRLASLHPDDFASQLDNVIYEFQTLREHITDSLIATGTRRRSLEQTGCVCAALPPAFNSRMVSQQGIFLLNCAEDLSFQESLTKMMGTQTGWWKTFDIPIDLIPEIEGRLFQMNIHEQSLFPDLEGLGGFIQQKMRRFWK